MPRSFARATLGFVLAALPASLWISREARSQTVKEEDAWTVSAVPPMERISGSEPIKPHATISMRAARAEYIAFQIVVTAGSRALTGVSVNLPRLTDERGDQIASDNIAVFREHYIEVTHPSPDPGWGNRPLGAGWYPDALIPIEAGKPGDRFEVAPRTNQPVWVDLHVPASTPRGNYQGTVRVMAGERTLNIQLAVRVWNFELPLKPTLLSSFGLHEPALTDVRMHKLLIEHRVMPESVNPQDARALIDDLGLNTTGLRFWSHFDKQTCTMDPAPAANVIAEAVKLYPADLPVHLYSADEIDPCPQVFDTVRRWAANMHTADPRIRNLVTVHPAPLLTSDGVHPGRSAVDIWALLPKDWDHHTDEIKAAQARGEEVWGYTALVQEAYSPKWEIDFAPVNYRVLPGFLAQSMGLTGILYWRVDLWTALPFEDLRGYSIDRSFYPGEGMLVYPGSGDTGPFASMRLKWIRQGVQDFEYVAILKRLGRGEWAMKRARAAAANWRQWTTDPQFLDVMRNQLGDEIDRLSPSGI